VGISVEPIAVHGEWIRHAPHRAALLGRKERTTAGRWQRDDVVRGLYLAANAETAIAEWYRWLAERALRPGSGVPHDHHRWEVSLEVADLSTAERLAAVGLQSPQPSRATWAPFQAVGEALWMAGWPGVLAPSAARPASNVLCVFADVWPPAGCFPAGSDEIHEVPPPPVGMTT
jgi:RES domain-containing protein